MQKDMKLVVNLSVTVFFVMMGFTIIIPNLPLYARSFKVSDTLIGALISGFGIARVVFDLPAGGFADRIGLKKIMMSGLIIIILSSILAAYAPSYSILFLARLLEGLGSAFYATSALTLLGKSTSARGRGRAMSVYVAMLLIGMMVGPAVGGFISDRYGLNSPFLAYAGVISIAAIWTQIVIRIPEKEFLRTSSDLHKSTLSLVPKLLGRRSLVAVYIASFALFFSRGGITATATPLYAYDNLGLSQTQLGTILTITAVFTFLTMIPAGSLSDRFGRKPLMLLCLGSTALATILIPRVEDLALFWVIMSIYGASLGLSGPMAAWAADLTPLETMGTSMGLYRMIGDAGLMSGPIIVGYLVEISRTSMVQPLPFEVSALILFAALLIVASAEDPVRALHSKKRI